MHTRLYFLTSSFCLVPSLKVYIHASSNLVPDTTKGIYRIGIVWMFDTN